MASIKTKDKEKKGLTVNTLVVRTLNRSILDVGQWRTALKAADNGSRQRLYDLYEDILIDTVLSKAIEKRINAITNAELNFMKDEKPVPEMDDLIDSPVMEEILTEIMNAKFWGKTVLELDFINGLQAFNIPRQHIRPEKGIIVINPGDDRGVEYRGDDFFLEAGQDKDFGLLFKAAPWAIVKRGNVADWAQFNELFGIPFKIGKYNAQDDAGRTVLEEALDKSGSAPWIVTPKETDVEIVNQGTKGNGDLFDGLRKASNEEILILILGQTMTTTQGSSRAQSETHKDVEEDTNKADRRFVQKILNTELLPRLEKRGFPVKGGWFTFPDAGETIPMKDQIAIHDAFQNKLGLIIDPDFLYDHYGVPKPKDGILKKEDPARDPIPDPNAKKKDEKKKLADNLTEAETSFWTKLKEGIGSFFVSAPSMGADRSDGNLPINLNLADLPPFDTESLAKRVSKGSDYFDPDQFWFTSNLLLKAIRLGFAEKNFAMGIDYGFTPDAYKTALEINLFQFSAAKTLSELQQLNEAFRASTGWYDFLKRAREISGKFNETWLRTEFDTAYNTAESSANYFSLLSSKDTYPFWQYITMNDGKVREEHLMIHGLVLLATDRLWNKIWPPNGWNCRCRVVPLLKSQAEGIDLEKEHARVQEFFKSVEWKKNAAQGFGTNRALTGNVFEANQMYIRKFPTKAASYLNKLTAEKWNLDSISKLMAAAKNEISSFNKGTADLWKEESRDKILSVGLYNNRTIEISEKEFLKLTNKRADRVQLWNALKETLVNPDEIWLNDDASSMFDNFSLIKYYKGKAVVTNYKVENGRLVLKLWEEMSPAKAIRDKKRKGLLIKR